MWLVSRYNDSRPSKAIECLTTISEIAMLKRNKQGRKGITNRSKLYSKNECGERCATNGSSSEMMRVKIFM